MFVVNSLVANDAAPFVATSPIAAQPHQPNARSSSTSYGGSHSNLIFIIGIAAGIAIVLAIAVVIICLCTFRRRNAKASEELGDKDIGTYPYVINCGL